MQKRLGRCIPLTALAGCAQAPSVNVLGAYFPDWLFCITAAVVLCFLLNGVLAAGGWLANMPAHLIALGHLSLATVIAISAWLLFFQH